MKRSSPWARLDDAHRHPPVACLGCGKALDSASGMDKAAPSAGDISMCMYCGHMAKFVDSDTIRQLTGAELIEVCAHPIITRAQRVRAAFMSDAGLAKRDKS
jgi:hypothetical protein